MMTAGNLRKILQDVPDATPVVDGPIACCDNHFDVRVRRTEVVARRYKDLVIYSEESGSEQTTPALVIERRFGRWPGRDPLAAAGNGRARRARGRNALARPLSVAQLPHRVAKALQEYARRHGIPVDGAAVELLRAALSSPAPDHARRTTDKNA